MENVINSIPIKKIYIEKDGKKFLVTKGLTIVDIAGHYNTAYALPQAILAYFNNKIDKTKLIEMLSAMNDLVDLEIVAYSTTYDGETLTIGDPVVQVPYKNSEGFGKAYSKEWYIYHLARSETRKEYIETLLKILSK